MNQKTKENLYWNNKVLCNFCKSSISKERDVCPLGAAPYSAALIPVPFSTILLIPEIWVYSKWVKLLLDWTNWEAATWPPERREIILFADSWTSCGQAGTYQPKVAVNPITRDCWTKYTKLNPNRLRRRRRPITSFNHMLKVTNTGTI